MPGEARAHGDGAEASSVAHPSVGTAGYCSKSQNAADVARKTSYNAQRLSQAGCIVVVGGKTPRLTYIGS
jgi:hypothetical protein